ncbi:hypothetical protein GCM10007049_30210 [Echinicola pacifica]|uniref:DUF3857 domain-containing protein n=1 Tax=Echinicola pacifica TaxID=346377 RepID=A0A918UUE6_9BACT|nr:hypothetical protein GCM10007049_30210 [Echinicola pacifica]
MFNIYKVKFTIIRLILSIILLFVVNILIFAQTVKVEPNIYSQLESSLEIELMEDFKVMTTYRETITILDKKGLDHAIIYIGYDGLTKIADFEAEIINPLSGKTLEKLKLKDLKDYSLTSSGSVFDDNRVKYFHLQSGHFPIQLSYSYTTQREGNFSLPRWRPQFYSNQLVKKAQLKVKYPEKIGLKYLEKFLDQNPGKVSEGGKSSLQWNLSDLIREEDSDLDSLPMVKLAPNQFSMEGYASDMNSWEGLGRWIALVNRGRDELPTEAKTLVSQMTAGLSTKEEKIAVLYDYLQENYRYVSIQLGIGGLQPMAASDTYRLKYGDCKALSMLMLSLLKEAGVNSNYTLVEAGRDAKDIEVGFPSNQFNHVILQVPDERDTLWLECTSSVLTPGFLGDFTMNRHVLVVNGEDGSLHKTPAYKSSKFNTITNESTVTLLDNGMATISQSKSLEGFAAQFYMQVENGYEEKDVKKLIYMDLGLTGASILDYKLRTEDTLQIPQAYLTHNTRIQNYYQSTSKRIIIYPKYQKIDISDIPNGYLAWVENMRFDLPGEMAAESGFEPLEVVHDSYDYHRSVVVSGTEMKVQRKVNFHLAEGLDEKQRKDLLKEVDKLDNQPIFLQR